MKISHLARNLIVAVFTYVSFFFFASAVVVVMRDWLKDMLFLDYAYTTGLALSAGFCLLLATATGWIAYRISRFAVGLHHILAFCSVGHSAAVLVIWFLSNHYALTFPFDAWVVLAWTWIVWPIASIVLPKRSPKSFVVSTTISLMLLSPGLSRLITLTPGSLGLWRWPREGQSVIERAENLGYGFSHLTIAELDPMHLGHLGYFYYRGRRISQHGAPPSVSPSGKFAIYQDGPSGKLFLFRRTDQKLIELTPKFVGVAYPFVWHEDQGTVEAQFQKGLPSMTFVLK